MEWVRKWLKYAGAGVLVWIVLLILLGALAKLYDVFGEWIRSKTAVYWQRKNSSAEEEDSAFFNSTEFVANSPRHHTLAEQTNSSRRASLDKTGMARSKSDLHLPSPRMRTMSDSASPQRASHVAAVKSTKEILADFQRALEDTQSPPPFVTGSHALREYSSDSSSSSNSEEEEEVTAPEAETANLPSGNRLSKRLTVASLALLSGLIAGGGHLLKNVLWGRFYATPHREEDPVHLLGFVLVSLAAIVLVYSVLLRRLAPTPVVTEALPLVDATAPLLASNSVDAVTDFCSKMAALNVEVCRGDPSGTELPSVRLVHSTIEYSALFCILVTKDAFQRVAVYDELSWAIAKRPDSTLVVVICDQARLDQTPVEYQTILCSVSAQIAWSSGASSEYGVLNYLKELVRRERARSKSAIYLWDMYVCHYRQSLAQDTYGDCISGLTRTPTSSLIECLAWLVSHVSDARSVAALLELLQAQTEEAKTLTKTEALALMGVLKARALYIKG